MPQASDEFGGKMKKEAELSFDNWICIGIIVFLGTIFFNVVLLNLGLAIGEAVDLEEIVGNMNTSYQDIAQEVTYEREFDIVKWNCWDYSTSLYQRLKENGYISKIVQGKTNASGTWVGHSWIELRLYIEATNGNVIPIEEYKSNYDFGYYGTEKHNFWYD
jgi:hypothetical protein